MLIIKVMEDAALAKEACQACGLPSPEKGQLVARAQEGEKTVGCGLFRLETPLVWVDRLEAVVEDDLVLDGLLRTCLNYAVGRSINCAQFGPDIDRGLLSRLYGETGEKDMENLAYFFQNCKNCSKCR